MFADSSDPLSTLQESPTRFPPTRPKSKVKDGSMTDKDIDSEAGMKTIHTNGLHSFNCTTFTGP